MTGQWKQAETWEGQPGYLWVIDAETLDFMQRQKNSDQKHLVFFFQRESKSIDDAVRQIGVVRRKDNQATGKDV